jgi:hypothetical protein
MKQSHWSNREEEHNNGIFGFRRHFLGKIIQAMLDKMKNET